MSGLLAKDSETTPAQLAITNSSREQMQNYLGKWLPVQSYFINQQQTMKGFNTQQTRGQVNAGVNAAEGQALNKFNSASGGQVGSGRMMSGLTGLTNNAAMSTASGLTSADAAARRDYVKGLQTSLGLTQKTGNLALQGMKTAGTTQAQEAGLAAAQDAQSQQGAAQIIGLAAAL